jgi:hypothetical protein
MQKGKQAGQKTSAVAPVAPAPGKPQISKALPQAKGSPPAAKSAAKAAPAAKAKPVHQPVAKPTPTLPPRGTDKRAPSQPSAKPSASKKAEGASVAPWLAAVAGAAALGAGAIALKKAREDSGEQPAAAEGSSPATGQVIGAVADDEDARSGGAPSDGTRIIRQRRVVRIPLSLVVLVLLALIVTLWLVLKS